MSLVRKNVLELNYRAYLAKVPYNIIILKCLFCTDFESYPNNSSVIAASITSNDSLEIIWPVLSKECLKYSSGVWIRVYQIGYELKSPVETFLSVPHKCVKKNSQNTYSIVLPPPSSISGKKDACFFTLARNLTQCRSYAVEVIPNFQTLRGKTLRAEIVIPPKVLVQ